MRQKCLFYATITPTSLTERAGLEPTPFFSRKIEVTFVNATISLCVGTGTRTPNLGHVVIENLLSTQISNGDIINTSYSYGGSLPSQLLIHNFDLYLLFPSRALPN